MTRFAHLSLWLALCVRALANTESAVFNAGDVKLTKHTESAGANLLVLGETRSWRAPLPVKGTVTYTAKISDKQPAPSLSSWLGQIEEQLGLDKRTLRVSWPASAPADFTFSLGDDFILITAHETAVEFPSLPLSGSHANLSREARSFEFDVLLERVHFGFLPASCLPLIALILAVLSVLRLTGLPGRVWSAIEGVAEGVAREEEERARKAKGKKA